MPVTASLVSFSAETSFSSSPSSMPAAMGSSFFLCLLPFLFHPAARWNRYLLGQTRFILWRFFIVCLIFNIRASFFLNRKCRSFVSLSSLSVLVLRTDSFCQSFRVENFHVSFEGSVSIVTFLCTRNKTTKLAGKGFLCSPIFQQILVPSFVTIGWKLCRLPHSTSPLR